MSEIISDIAAAQEDKKSLDKKEIEDEEKEKMLKDEETKPEKTENKDIIVEEKAKDQEEEKKDKGKDEVEKEESKDSITQEGREVKPKFIPIGGIKMPGFFTRSKSKERCKDDGADGELLEKTGNEDVEAGAKEGEDKTGTSSGGRVVAAAANIRNRLANIKIPKNPFNKKPKATETPAAAEGEEQPKEGDETVAPGPVENGEPQQTASKKGLINAIKLPIVNMLPRRLRGGGGGDVESGLDSGKQAGLASMETLDDNKDMEKVELQSNEDGMENVKLEIEEKADDGKDVPKEKLNWQERIRQQKCIIDDWAVAGGILLFIILLIIIIVVTCSGGVIRVAPIKDGKYVDAVTSCGLVEGVMEDGAFAFRGIPYAAPPTGNNRWRPAQPLDNIALCWNGTLKAHNATDVCSQTYLNGTYGGVEDCLTMDVITPHVRYDNPLPVIVLIGSDTLLGGSPGKLRPSSVYARSKDVLFVRPNFRLGVLGFLSIDAISKTAYPPSSGNYALSDIITALKWVQLNIKNFGGDPRSVTVVGHRAGGTLVTALLNYKKADKLFARAWVSSGASLFPGKPLKEYELSNARYMDIVNCTNAKCLREKSVDELLESVPDLWRSGSYDLPTTSEEPNNRHEWLVLDGSYLTDHFANDFPTSKIPVVFGTTAHVAASEKLLLRHTTWTPELVAQHVRDSHLGKNNLADEALRRYNATYQGLASMVSDIRTVCPLLSIARLRPSTPFYIVTQPGGELNISDVDSDISAILGRYEPKTPEQRRYVSAMQQLFYHYIWHGAVPQSDVKRNLVVLQVGQDVLPQTDYPNCDYWIQNNIVPLFARLD